MLLRRNSKEKNQERIFQMRRSPPSAVALRSILRRKVRRTPRELHHGALRSEAPWWPARRTEVRIATRPSKAGPTACSHASARRAVDLLLPIGLLLLPVRLLLIAGKALVRVALHRTVLRKLPSPGRVSVLRAVACFV